MQADEIVLEANHSAPQYLVNGHWNTTNFTVDNYGETTMNLQINGNITATNADIRTHGPEDVFTNFALNGELSATHLAMQTTRGGLLTVQNTGTIRSNYWRVSCQDGRTDIFNWGDLLTRGSLSMVANGTSASANLWQDGTFQVGDMKVEATDGGMISLQSQGNFDLGSLILDASGDLDTQRSKISVRNAAGVWQVGSLFANSTNADLDLLNQGSASIATLFGYCTGQDASGRIANSGNLSINNLNLHGSDGNLRLFNDGRLNMTNVYLRASNITNYGSLGLVNMRIFAGDGDVAGITNRENIHVRNSDIDVFSPAGDGLVLINNHGEALFENIDLLSNVPLVDGQPPVGAADNQILLNCFSGGCLTVKNLNSGTAGSGSTKRRCIRMRRVWSDPRGSVPPRSLQDRFSAQSSPS